MIFSNQKNDAEKAREFVLEALIRHHRGDSQIVHAQLSEFLESPAGIAMLEKYAELQAEVHEVWKMAGFGPTGGVVPTQEPVQEPAEMEGIDAEISEEKSVEFPDASDAEDALSKPDADVPLADAGNEDMPARPDAPVLHELENEPARPDTPVLDEIEQESVQSDAHEPLHIAENEDVIHIDLGSPGDTPPTTESEPEMTYNPRIHLSNGKVQTAYDFDLRLALPDMDLDELVSITETGLAAAGLALDVESLHIQGTPETAGQFPLTFSLQFAEGAPLEFHADLDIIPDPRALWKALEPDPSLPYAKPHTDAALLHGGGRNLLAASVRGRSHAHKAGFRDDDFAIDFHDAAGWHLIAVADGAGSAAYSRRGAALACDVALDSLRQADFTAFEAGLLPALQAYRAQPDDQNQRQVRHSAYGLLSQAAFAAYKAIQEEAEAIDEPLRQFHTTLILTIAHQFDFGWFIATWWVGDGGMGVYRQGEAVEVLGSPDGGEFAGQTRFLTMPEIWADGEAIMGRIGFQLTDDFTAVMLMTDGVTDPKIETDYNLTQVPVWDKLWADLSAEIDFSPDNAQAPEQLLQWLQFWSPGDHDDRTIAILY